MNESSAGSSACRLERVGRVLGTPRGGVGKECRPARRDALVALGQFLLA
jgi:hypothetical protein